MKENNIINIRFKTKLIYNVWVIESKWMTYFPV